MIVVRVSLPCVERQAIEKKSEKTATENRHFIITSHFVDLVWSSAYPLNTNGLVSFPVISSMLPG
jgi:hypothetical protein